MGAIFLNGIKAHSDLDTIAAQVKLPLILGRAGKELMDRDWLAQRGVPICLQGHQPFAAAVRARSRHAARFAGRHTPGENRNDGE